MLYKEILSKLKKDHPNAKDAVLEVIAKNLAKGKEKIEDVKAEDFTEAVEQIAAISGAFTPAKKPEEKAPETKAPEAAGSEDALTKALARIEALELAAKTSNAKDTTKSFVGKLATELNVKEDVVNALLKEDVNAENYDTVKAGLQSSVKLVSESFGGGEYVPSGNAGGDPDDEKAALDDVSKFA